MEKMIIYTDLDGTLLDHYSYDFSPAAELINDLLGKSVTIIPVTSKTRAETVELMEKIGLNGPFVVENGGAVYLPSSMAGLLPYPLPLDDEGIYLQKTIGRPIADWAGFPAEFAARTGLKLTTFADMTVSQVAGLTGLPERQAALASLRQFDLPCVLDPCEVKALDQLRREAIRAGLRLHQGGRFLHLSADYDKATALNWLNSIWSAIKPGFTSIGLGDAENDLAMLECCDYPWLVRSNDNSRTDVLAARLPRARLTSKTGPAGWKEAVSASLALISGGKQNG